MEGFKDRPSDIFWLGILTPGAILLLVAFNVVAWRVYWPAERGTAALIEVYTDTWRVVGTVLMKTGLAGALVSWYLLANLKQTERTAELWLALSIVLVVAGLVAVVVGFLL